MKDTKQMKSVKVEQSKVKKVRRDLLTKGGITVGTLSALPGSWTKPMVEAVVVPVHAQMSPTTTVPPVCSPCDVTLSITARDIPVACSGTSFPPIVLNGAVSAGCGNIIIDSIVFNLPAPATGSVNVAVGAELMPGTSFMVTVNNYPSASAFACTATAAGALAITYHCAEDPAMATQTFNLDILSEILKGRVAVPTDNALGENVTKDQPEPF